MGSRGRRVEEEDERCSTQRVAGFIRIITPTILSEGKMELLDKFVRRFGEEMGEIASISVPSGDVWMVGVERRRIGNEEEEMLLLNNMKELMHFYGVQPHYLFIFTYKGESNFSVVICDTSAAEIPYRRLLL